MTFPSISSLEFKSEAIHHAKHKGPSWNLQHSEHVAEEIEEDGVEEEVEEEIDIEEHNKEIEEEQEKASAGGADGAGSSSGAGSPLVRVDCSKTTGQLKGFYFPDPKIYPEYSYYPHSIDTCDPSNYVLHPLLTKWYHTTKVSVVVALGHKIKVANQSALVSRIILHPHFLLFRSRSNGLSSLPLTRMSPYLFITMPPMCSRCWLPT